MGNNFDQLMPQKICLSKIMSIICGGCHTIVITVYNKIYVWGDNDSGQLGVGDNKDRNKPCLLEFKF